MFNHNVGNLTIYITSHYILWKLKLRKLLFESMRSAVFGFELFGELSITAVTIQQQAAEGVNDVGQ